MVHTIPPEIHHKIATLRTEIYALAGVAISPDTNQHWHIAVTETNGNPIGAARLRVHDNPRFEDLDLSANPSLREPVEGILQEAASNEWQVVEIGGLVCTPGTGVMAAKRIVQEIKRLGAEMGWLGICTATHRHRSAALLRRLGGEEILEYFDRAYQCAMSLLVFRPKNISQ